MADPKVVADVFADNFESLQEGNRFDNGTTSSKFESRGISFASTVEASSTDGKSYSISELKKTIPVS